MTSSPLSPELIAWGAIYTPIIVPAGQAYWRLVQATGPQDIGGNHHLYVDVLDEAGQRVVGAEVLFFSNSEQWPAKTEAKTGEPYCANLPMTAGGQATPMLDVVKMFHDYFGPGTPIYDVTIVGDGVSAMVSDKAAMLISKVGAPRKVALGRDVYELAGYDVRVVLP